MVTEQNWFSAMNGAREAVRGRWIRTYDIPIMRGGRLFIQDDSGWLDLLDIFRSRAQTGASVFSFKQPGR